MWTERCLSGCFLSQILNCKIYVKLHLFSTEGYPNWQTKTHVFQNACLLPLFKASSLLDQVVWWLVAFVVSSNSPTEQSCSMLNPL